MTASPCTAVPAGRYTARKMMSSRASPRRRQAEAYSIHCAWPAAGRAVQATGFTVSLGAARMSRTSDGLINGACIKSAGVAKGRNLTRTRRPAAALAVSKRVGGEGVALPQVAAVQAALEPAHALRRRAVGEGIGHHVPLALLLQRVVSDGAGRGQAFFDVARLEDIARLVCAAGPQAGE